jgi:hypothetical protein
LDIYYAMLFSLNTVVLDHNDFNTFTLDHNDFNNVGGTAATSLGVHTDSLVILFAVYTVRVKCI